MKKIKKRLGRLLKGLKKGAGGVFLKEPPTNLKVLTKDNFDKVHILLFGGCCVSENHFV